jgi:hypothetical protein
MAVDGELGEDVARGLVEDGRLLVAADGGDVGGGVPGGFSDELAGGGAAAGGDDAVVVDGTVAGAGLGLDGVGVVPVVDAVDVGVVEPEASVVGMVGAFAGQGRIAAGERGAVGREERVEDGLALVGLPEVRGKGRAVDGDVDAMGGGVNGDGDAFCWWGGVEHGGEEEENEQKQKPIRGFFASLRMTIQNYWMTIQDL